MTLPAHPYWLSVPTMVMGYITGSNKYSGNPVDKSTVYSFLGTSTFLMSLRNFGITTSDTELRYKPSVRIIGNIFAATLLTGSYYCMGHLIGLAGNKKSENIPTAFKNLIEPPRLQ